MKKTIPVLVAAVFVAALLLGIIAKPLQKNGEQVFSPVRYCGRVLVVDAGHGGEDGGAVSVSGVTESTVNLAIARRLDCIMGLFGVPVVMLRTEDISLHSEGADSLREKKSSDLHNRVAAVNSVENAVLISIHQNTFPDPRYYGAQVFYAPTEGSRLFAEYMQEVLRVSLDKSNDRQAAPIAQSVYLMNNISCPAILTECGFLSNAAEDQLLQTPEYQLMVAVSLAGAYLQYQHMTEG